MNELGRRKDIVKTFINLEVTTRTTMSTSGIKVAAAAIKAFDELQEHQKYKFVMLKFNAAYKEIVIDEIGAKDATFSNLLEVLPKDRVRFIFYDCDYKTVSGQKRNKVLCVTWSSDDHAVAKEKMLASSSSKDVERVCEKCAKYVTINSWEELTEDNFINIVSDNRRK